MNLRRPVFDFLKKNQFSQVSSESFDIDPERTIVMQNDIGWIVLLTRNEEGYSGEVRDPDGLIVSTTSWVDINWLQEKLLL
jgi:hypothetical protein